MIEYRKLRCRLRFHKWARWESLPYMFHFWEVKTTLCCMYRYCRFCGTPEFN